MAIQPHDQADQAAAAPTAARRVIRVLLVEDHASFRQSLAFMLEREPDVAVVGQAGALAEARRLLNDVDVAVIDLSLSDGSGLELIRELRAASPHGAALVLTASQDPRELARVVEAGAAAALHKSVRLEDIIRAVRRLAAGETLFAPREVVEWLRQAGDWQAQDRAAQVALGRLTARERQVLQALAEGLTDKEIAQRLQVGALTVRSHMASILNKLGVDSRLQALVFALRHGAITLG